MSNEMMLMNGGSSSPAVVHDDESVDTEHDGMGTALVPVSSLDAITRGEVSQQIATAKKYPRVLSAVLDEALTLATMNVETAQSCYYRLERRDKDGKKNKIEGPSIRLAEIIASAWGNLRYGARVLDITDTHVVAQGYCADLQKNVAISTEVQRNIVTKTGKRFGQDMITVTVMAAQSIAMRNAILRVVPRVYADGILKRAKEVAVGTLKTLGERRVNIVARLKTTFGVTEERILAAVEARTIEDIDLDKLGDLIGIGTALSEGRIKVHEAFPEQQAAAAAPAEPTKAPDVAAHVAAVAAQAQAAAPKEAPAAKGEKKEQPDDTGAMLHLDALLKKAKTKYEIENVRERILAMPDSDAKAALLKRAEEKLAAAEK